MLREDLNLALKDAMKAKNGAAARQLGEFYRRERKRYLKFKKSLAKDIDDWQFWNENIKPKLK